MDYRTLLLQDPVAASTELQRLLFRVKPPSIYGEWNDTERYGAIPGVVRNAFESLAKNILDVSVPPGLTILGKPGVGKTCAVYAMARTLLRDYWFEDRFTMHYTPQVIEHVEWVQVVRKIGLFGLSAEERANALQEIDGFCTFPGFLFIDDIGVAPMSDQVSEYFYSLVDGRLKNRRPTVFISNATPTELAHALDPRVSHRLMRWTRVLEYS